MTNLQRLEDAVNKAKAAQNAVVAATTETHDGAMKRFKEALAYAKTIAKEFQTETR